MKHLFALALLLSVAACTPPHGADTSAGTTTTDSTAAPTTNMVDLDRFDMPLLVNVPQNGHDPMAIMNEERGRAEVRAGDHFGLIITEMEPDFERLKADLERDMLVKNTIVEETPDLIAYTSEFPDGTGTFAHFMQVVRSGDRTFVVEDLPDGRFNESDRKSMVGAVSAKPVS